LVETHTFAAGTATRSDDRRADAPVEGRVTLDPARSTPIPTRNAQYSRALLCASYW
jgi:hypothetical protein